MEIKLRRGYAIVTGQHYNWKLTSSSPRRQRPRVVGYYPDLHAALRAAVMHGVVRSNQTLALSKLERLVNRVAKEILQLAKDEGAGIAVQERAGATIES